MKTRDIILNIAVNLGRISRFAMEKREVRINQFLKETEEYLDELNRSPKSTGIEKTLNSFKKYFQSAKNSAERDEAWAEAMLTWGNILTHRAKIT